MSARPGDIIEFKHCMTGERIRIGRVTERYFIKDSLYSHRVDKTFCKVEDLINRTTIEVDTKEILHVYKREVIE